MPMEEKDKKYSLITRDALITNFVLFILIEKEDLLLTVTTEQQVYF